MHRVCVDPESLSATHVTLPPAASHYVRTVLRLRSGQNIQVFDGAGREYCVRLTSVSSASVQGDVIDVVPTTLPLTPLILGQALPKHPRMDLIVEKCSELGLTTLVPLYTERTVVRAVDDRIRDKIGRWQRLATAAARQCQRQTVLEIQPPQSFADFCACYAAVPAKILCWEEEQQQGLRQVLPARTGLSPVAVLVGPEGGFAPQEIALARAHGFQTVSLGPLTLRTETAAIVITTIVRYSLHELEPQKEHP